jgi:hypothetical protein
MMGAGGVLRWEHNATLQRALDTLIDGIDSCKQSNGFIMAYEVMSRIQRESTVNFGAKSEPTQQKISPSILCYFTVIMRSNFVEIFLVFYVVSKLY